MTVFLGGHNVCFHEKIRKIIIELSSKTYFMCTSDHFHIRYVVLGQRSLNCFMLSSAEHEILNADKYKNNKKLCIFVAPALAGRHRRASFRPFVHLSVRTSVRPSIRQHLTWVFCERNSYYSFAPIVLKLCLCFPHGMRMCMWIGHNCWINFCHFFDIVNLVIFHPDYIDRGYLL